MKTIVIFRKFKEGDILALFPFEEHNGPLCVSYQHIGQHSGADYGHCIDITRPAKPEEYEPLRRELVSIGYDLEIRSRLPSTRKAGA